MYSTLEALPRKLNLGKQVVEDDGKQVVEDDGKQIQTNRGEIEPIAKEKSCAPEVADDQIRPRQHLRWREIALISVLGSMVILAAVVGGVLGSQRRRLEERLMMNPSLPNRNIAALSYVSGPVNNTHVYFQDDGGQIMESVSSANNASQITWSVNGLGFNATNGSALAAAVSRPGFPFVSHVLSTP